MTTFGSMNDLASKRSGRDKVMGSGHPIKGKVVLRRPIPQLQGG